MKKYATFPVDCTTLATETMAYLNQHENVEDIEHQSNAFHVLAQDDLTDISANIPSLASTFPGMTIKMVAHITVNTDVMFNTEYNSNFILIPLDDCETVELKILNVTPGAVKIDSWFYDDEDCTLDESTMLNSPASPIIVRAGTTHTLETTSFNLADLLLIAFSDNTDSYLD